MVKDTEWIHRHDAEAEAVRVADHSLPAFIGGK
jgi:hypothetical protein